jgi:diadenosine tetraphosphate (Ap4A) HIT family hydrolase
MSDCVFCKIADGKIPSYKIYEDENFIAFADAHPIVDGHTLVIPKKHYENIFDLSDELAGKINLVCKKVAILLKEKFGVNAVNIVNASGKAAQQSVFHIHYHIVPRKENDKLDLWFHKN